MSKPELKLDWCSHKAAKFAVENWHYSRTLPTPPLVKVGVWESGGFVGSVIFGRGATNNLGKPYGLKNTEVCELVRVALAKHITPTSRIVAIAIKLMAHANQRIKLIVSFADTNHGHHGGIYQAGGWVYAGQTIAGYKLSDATGRIWHSRQCSSTGVSRQYGKVRRVPKIQDCTKIPEKGKHRYLMPLDDEMRERIKPLAKPYPKRVANIDSDVAVIQTAKGGASPTATLQKTNAKTA